MRFDYTAFMRHTSRRARPAALALIISLFALFAVLAGGAASPQERKFTMADATTTEDNGRRLRPKAGFELVAVNKTTVVARKVSKPTQNSVDKVECKCSPTPPKGYECYSGSEGGVKVCGGDGSSSCCKWVHVK